MPRNQTTTPDNLAQGLEPLSRHVTMHRLMWLLVVVSGFIAWNRGLALLYSLVALLLAVLLLSYLGSWWNVRGINVQRNLPTMAEVGVPFAVAYTVSATGTRHFVGLHEQWALRANTTADVFLERIEPETSTIENRIENHQRGEYHLDALTLRCGFPFGLFERNRTVQLQAQTLTVLPRMFNIQHLPLRLSSQIGQGELRSQHRGGQDEFAGLREYRRGDAMKTIHWGATARQIARNQPWQVKTYESFDRPSVLIVLNSVDLLHEDFECMLSIAASITRHACWMGHATTIALSTNTSAVIEYTTVPPNSEHLYQDMRVFATAQLARRHAFDGSKMYQNNVKKAIENHYQCNTVVTFSFDAHQLHVHRNHLHFCFTNTTGANQKSSSNHGTLYRINANVHSLDDIAALFT